MATGGGALPAGSVVVRAADGTRAAWGGFDAVVANEEAGPVRCRHGDGGIGGTCCCGYDAAVAYRSQTRSAGAQRDQTPGKAEGVVEARRGEGRHEAGLRPGR